MCTQHHPKVSLRDASHVAALVLFVACLLTTLLQLSLVKPQKEEIARAEFCYTARKNKVTKWIAYNAEGPSQAPPPTPASPTVSPAVEETAAPTKTPPRNEEKTSSPTVSATTEPTEAETASPTEVMVDEDGTSPPTEGAAPSPTPTSDGLVDVLPEVEVVSGSYCTPETPCAQCFGDCDTDDDCQGELTCFQRDGGQAVPSCSGGESSVSGKDFNCVLSCENKISTIY
jgi:cytoskeletal protein RodZ